MPRSEPRVSSSARVRFGAHSVFPNHTSDLNFRSAEWDEFKTLDWEAVYASMAKPAYVLSRPTFAQRLHRLTFVLINHTQLRLRRSWYPRLGQAQENWLQRLHHRSRRGAVKHALPAFPFAFSRFFVSARIIDSFHAPSKLYTIPLEWCFIASRTSLPLSPLSRLFSLVFLSQFYRLSLSSSAVVVIPSALDTALFFFFFEMDSLDRKPSQFARIESRKDCEREKRYHVCQCTARVVKTYKQKSKQAYHTTSHTIMEAKLFNRRELA